MADPVIRTVRRHAHPPKRGASGVEALSVEPEGDDVGVPTPRPPGSRCGESRDRRGAVRRARRPPVRSTSVSPPQAATHRVPCLRYVPACTAASAMNSPACGSVGATSRSAWMDGVATATTAMSRTRTNCAMQSKPSRTRGRVGRRGRSETVFTVRDGGVPGLRGFARVYMQRNRFHERLEKRCEVSDRRLVHEPPVLVEFGVGLRDGDVRAGDDVGP